MTQAMLVVLIAVIGSFTLGLSSSIRTAYRTRFK